MAIKKVSLVTDKKFMKLCRKPYPNHKKGCPNFNKKPGCPPHTRFIEDVIYSTCYTYAIWTCFDLKSHVDRMKKRHPYWSQRQLECCLYWQGTARKNLRQEIERFKRWANRKRKTENKKLIIFETPEAHGVNVTVTMLNLGVRLQWPPKTITYQVAIAGLLRP